VGEKEDRRSSVRGVRFAQDRSRETLRRILEAAEQLFAEKGYDKTSVADIISRAGIGHGTFWLYFRNKEDLLQFMLRDMIKEIEAFGWYAEDNLEDFPVTTLQQVEDIIRGVMDVFARYSTIHPPTMRASLESEDFRAALEELNRPFVHILETKLREHLEKGLCRGLDPEVSAYIILAMLEYTNVQLANKSLPADRDAIIHNLSSIIYHTLNHA
jgi:AcrR family transcriptional regulator